MNLRSEIEVERMGGLKKQKIRSLIRCEEADFMAVQETKLDQVDRVLCESLWGDKNVNWAWVPSEGRSGGIISLWNRKIFTISYTFSGKRIFGCVWGIMFMHPVILMIRNSCGMCLKCLGVVLREICGV